MKFITLILMLCALHSQLSLAQSDELPEIEAEVDGQFSDSRVSMEESSANTASADTQVLNSAPITVDGYVKEAPQEDQELVQIKSEIQRQKKELVLNKQKAKSYNELSKSVEVLSETTEEMLEEKREARTQIAEYNEKVKCLQMDNPGPECDKYVKRRR